MKKINFTRGSIIKSIISFSIPLMLGEVLQNIYNSADAIVVGNLVGDGALAAVTVSGVVSSMIVTFFNGMSVGTNVVISRAYGGADENVLHSKMRIAFSSAAVLGAFLSLLGVIFTPQLLSLAGARQEYYADALIYLRIYLAGLMFTVIYNNGAGILRATGDSATPLKILMITCCTNILLDILFVGVFHLGVAGVGIATAIAQAISVILVCRAINRSQNIRCINFREMYFQGKSTILEILRIGTAAGLQSALIGFSNIFVMRYVNLFSTASVAGIGIVQRLDKFIVLPAKSFGITITTFVGQNIGAGNYARVREGKWKCLLVAVSSTLCISGIVCIFAKQSVALFTSDPAVISIGIEMLRVILPVSWTMSIREVYIGLLRGNGKNIAPMVLSLFGMVGCRQVFLAITMHYNPAIKNIYYCYPIAWIITTLLILGYYFLARGQFKENHLDASTVCAENEAKD